MPSETDPAPDENDFVQWPSAPGTSLTGLDKSMILASVEELAPSLAPGGPLPASTSFSDQEEGGPAGSGKFYPASSRGGWFRTTEPLAAEGEKERWWQDDAPAAPIAEKAPAPEPLAKADGGTAGGANEAALSPEAIWEMAAKELSRAAALPEDGAPETPAVEPEAKKPKVVLPERKRPAAQPPARQAPPAAASPFLTVDPSADNTILSGNTPATAEPPVAAPGGNTVKPEVASPFFFVPEESEPAKTEAEGASSRLAAEIAKIEAQAAEEGELVILPPHATPPHEESAPPFLTASPFSLDPPSDEPSRGPLLPAQRMFQQVKVVEPGAPATPPLQEVHGDDIVFPSSDWAHSPASAPHAQKRLRAAEPEIQEATPEPEPRRSKAGIVLWLLLLILLAAAGAALIWREHLPEPWRGRVQQAWDSVFFSFEQVPTRPVSPHTPPAATTPAVTPPVSSPTSPEATTPIPAADSSIPAESPGTQPAESAPPALSPDENASALAPTPAETPPSPPQPAENETLTPAPGESPATPEAEPSAPEEEPAPFPGIIVPQSGAAGSAQTATPNVSFSGEVPLAEAAELAQAKETVAALITASTVEEMLPCVFDAAALEAKMREYYAAHPLKPLHDAVIEMEYSGVIPSNGLRAYIFNVLHPSRPKGFPVAAEFSDGRYLVDWESHVQWRDEWLRTFLSSKKNTPQSLMLVLHRTHYFNDDVPLLDEKLAFKATSAIPGDEGAVVFVDKQSALGRSLASEYEWRVSYFPLAELQWVTENEKQYVRLNRIVRPNWRRNPR